MEHDDTVRVIVLHGEGDFSLQVQILKNLHQLHQAKNFRSLAASGQEVFERLETFLKTGYCCNSWCSTGWGLELAMGCHMRIVTENAKLGLPELQLGLIPGFAGTQRLPRYVGYAKAAEMLLTSEPISGKEAVQLGLSKSCLYRRRIIPKTHGTCKENCEEKSSCM